jgi:MoaA/NifB/PqqE/SkfB family radical SAM enzyme
MSVDALLLRTWSENRLFSVLVELTYRCNLDCFFCYNDVAAKGTPMSFDDYRTLLQDLADMRVLNVTLTGGEPLAHPDFFRIGACARELGFVVRVKSNGHALSGRTLDRLVAEVDPFVIEVSLHGAVAETHDRQTRVPGSFVRLIDNVRAMVERGCRVKVNSTLTLWNEEETAAMYALCDALGVPLRFDLQVSPRDDGDRSALVIAPSAAGVQRLLRVETERSLRFEDCAPPAGSSPGARPEKHCGAGSAGIAVDPYGNVYPCVQWRRSVANLHSRRMRDIWADSFGRVREETTEAARVVAAHPQGALLNFCPGLAEMMTGSPTTVPKEMEQMAAIVGARPEYS